jgi:hypothetical protein
MFYDSRLSQNDLDMIAIFERKRDLFIDDKNITPINVINQMLSDENHSGTKLIEESTNQIL